MSIHSVEASSAAMSVDMRDDRKIGWPGGDDGIALREPGLHRRQRSARPSRRLAAAGFLQGDGARRRAAGWPRCLRPRRRHRHRRAAARVCRAGCRDPPRGDPEPAHRTARGHLSHQRRGHLRGAPGGRGGGRPAGRGRIERFGRGLPLQPAGLEAAVPADRRAPPALPDRVLLAEQAGHGDHLPQLCAARQARGGGDPPDPHRLSARISGAGGARQRPHELSPLDLCGARGRGARFSAGTRAAGSPLRVLLHLGRRRPEHPADVGAGARALWLPSRDQAPGALRAPADRLGAGWQPGARGAGLRADAGTGARCWPRPPRLLPKPEPECRPWPASALSRSTPTAIPPRMPRRTASAISPARATPISS